MIEVFKTNVRRKNDAKRLLKIFNRHCNECKINFDLSDCDKVLRVEGTNICPDKIIEMVTVNGYQCEVLV